VKRYRAFSLLAAYLALSSLAAAQTTSTLSALPRLVRFSGTASDIKGNPLSGVVGITFALYSGQTDGSPLWMETQNVNADSHGRYAVLLGVTKPEGLPPDVFTTEQAHWVGVQVEGQAEQPRVLLLSVPYALKAGDAETIGGLPPSAFVLAAPSPAAAAKTENTAATAAGNAPLVSITGAGTVNFLPLWDTTSDIISSVIFQSGSGSTAKIGIHNTTPAAALDVKGGAVVRGALQLPSQGTATAGAGFNSDPFNLLASSFNSGTATAVSQTFQWQAEPTGNDTASPSGTLNLLFGSGAKPTETGLNIASNGQITFASGQTFPGTGTGTVTSVGSGAGLTGGPIKGSGTLRIATGGVTNVMLANPSLTITAGTDLSGGGTVALGGSITLNLNTTATDARYAQLGANNTFTGTQTINNTTIMSGTNTAGVLQVTNTAVTGKAPAIVGTTNSTAAHAIKGIVTATSGNLAGVFGQTSSPTGYGVNGSASAGGIGVYGSGGTGVEGLATTGYGVYGVLSAPSALGSDNVMAGVWGDTSVAPGGSFGPAAAGVLGTADQGAGGAFLNTGLGDLEPALVGFNLGSNLTGPVFQTFGAAGACSIYANGSLACDGSKSAVVPVDGGTRRVALYAVEAPENWFEDIGSGLLSNGSARIDLDPTFAQTVNTGVGYHVFLTPNGDCKGLYVSRKSAASFEVHEFGGGTSNIEFDYRIVAKRSGYENIRLADFTERYNGMEAQRERMRQLAGQRRAQPAAAETPALKPANAATASSVVGAANPRAIQTRK